MSYTFKKSREQGFSLVELLVVVVIIGILAAIAIPLYTNQKNRSYKATAVDNITSIGNEIIGVLASYTNMGTGPTITFDTIVDNETTADITPGINAVPNTGMITTETLRANTGATITGTIAPGEQPDEIAFCLVETFNAQVAVFTNAGYQPDATGCASDGTATTP